MPLAPYPGCAVFPLQATADDCLGYRPRPLVELYLPIEYYPATPTRPSQRPSPLMGSCSLQHLRYSRSTRHESSRLATFRLQGLVTLLTAYSLESRAGFLSHRQRSWDSPFGGFLSRKISATFRPGRTHIPLTQRYFRRRSVRPARRASVSGSTSCESALRSCRFLSRRPLAPPLGFSPLGFTYGDLDPDFSRPPLACLTCSDDHSSNRPAPQSLSRPPSCFARPTPKHRTGRNNPSGVSAPARS